MWRQRRLPLRLRSLQFRRKLCVTIEIVIDDWLFNPGKSRAIDHMTPLQSVGEIQALIEISH